MPTVCVLDPSPCAMALQDEDREFLQDEDLEHLQDVFELSTNGMIDVTADGILNLAGVYALEINAAQFCPYVLASLPELDGLTICRLWDHLRPRRRYRLQLDDIMQLLSESSRLRRLRWQSPGHTRKAIGAAIKAAFPEDGDVRVTVHFRGCERTVEWVSIRVYRDGCEDDDDEDEDEDE